MKIFIALSLFITTFAYGLETRTECPWMREMNKRNNPKANLVGKNFRIKVESKSSSSVKQ